MFSDNAKIIRKGTIVQKGWRSLLVYNGAFSPEVTFQANSTLTT